jgi:hypothetical protein
MCVGVWLEQNGFQDLIKPFVKNGINGEALGSLSEADLVAMKIDKLAVRKNVLKAIAALTAGGKNKALAATVEKEIGAGGDAEDDASSR